MSLFINESPEERANRLTNDLRVIEDEILKLTFERQKLTEKKRDISQFTNGELALEETIRENIFKLDELKKIKSKELEELLQQLSQKKDNEK